MNGQGHRGSGLQGSGLQGSELPGSGSSGSGSPRELSDEIRALLSAFADGEVTPSERSLVESQLATNAAARAYLKTLQSVIRTVSELPDRIAPPRYTATMVGRLDRKPGIPGFASFLRLAPIAALGAVALVQWGAFVPGSDSNGQMAAGRSLTSESIREAFPAPPPLHTQDEGAQAGGLDLDPPDGVSSAQPEHQKLAGLSREDAPGGEVESRLMASPSGIRLSRDDSLGHDQDGFTSSRLFPTDRGALAYRAPTSADLKNDRVTMMEKMPGIRAAPGAEEPAVSADEVTSAALGVRPAWPRKQGVGAVVRDVLGELPMITGLDAVAASRDSQPRYRFHVEVSDGPAFLMTVRQVLEADGSGVRLTGYVVSPDNLEILLAYTSDSQNFPESMDRLYESLAQSPGIAGIAAGDGEDPHSTEVRIRVPLVRE